MEPGALNVKVITYQGKRRGEKNSILIKVVQFPKEVAGRRRRKRRRELMRCSARVEPWSRE